MKVVVAHHNEDISWLKRIESDHEVIVVEKLMPNVGRDVATHLLYILTNFQSMQGDYLFCQAEPFWHHPWFVSDIGTRRYFGWNMTVPNDGYHLWTNMTRFNTTPITVNEMLNRMGLPVVRNFHFRQGCQFVLSGEEVRRLNYQRLAAAFSIAVLPEGPFGLELMLPMIYPPLIGELRRTTEQTTPSRRPDEPWSYMAPEELDLHEAATKEWTCSPVSVVKPGQ